MAVSLRTWTDDETITHTKLNADNTAIAAKFNSGITTDDLSGSAAITNAQLANKHYEIVVNMQIDGLAWKVGAAGDVVAMAGLPADVNAVGYTILQVDWCFTCFSTNAIASAPKFDLDWGYFGSDTAWTQSTAIVDAQSIGTVTANQGSAGTSSLENSTITTSTTNVQFFGLKVDTLGDFDTSDHQLCVSIKLKRTNGLRS